MPLFTIVMDYAGGTYIDQVDAPSVNLACIKWAENLDSSQIYGIKNKRKELLMREMQDASPVQLDGLVNAWCTSALVAGRLALINIIKTER